MAAPRTRPSSDRLIYMPTTASVQIDPGDLLYSDSGVAKPATSMADAGTPAGNKAAFAAAFIGVSNGQKRVEDTGTGEIPVIVGSDIEFSLAAPATLAVGDYLSVVENAGGDGIVNQLVEKTTTANQAIAIVTENKTSASRIFAAPITPLTGLIAS